MPSVAMKLSICATSTSRPLITPANAPHSTISTASGQGTPYMVCSLIARMCQMTMPKPTVRSMRPAVIGIIAPSESSAMIAFVGEDRAQVEHVGKVRQQDPRRGCRARSGSEAVDRQGGRPLPTLSPTSSERVGSSAFDLSDCMTGLFGFDPGQSAATWPILAEAAAIRASVVRSPRQLGDNPPAVEHQRPMADVGDFLEIGGNQQDRRPAPQRDVEQTVDLGLGADIDTRCRILGDIDLALPVQPAADHDLLLVAARQPLDRERGIIGAQADCRPRREPAASSSGSAGVGERRNPAAIGLRNRFSRTEARHRQLRHAVARHEIEPFDSLRGETGQNGWPSNRMRPLGKWRKPKQRAADRFLARAAQADQTDDRRRATGGRSGR